MRNLKCHLVLYLFVGFIAVNFALSARMVTASEIIKRNIPTAVRHTLSEIVDVNSQWEKIATSNGFIEGINFDRNGTMWVTGMLSGKIMKFKNGDLVAIGEPYGQPNGAKFHKDGRLFVTDRGGELYALDVSNGKRTTICTKYGPAHLRGLNDLIFDNNGGVFFTEPYGSSATNPCGRVFYLPPDKDAKLRLFQENLAYPNGIAISADGQRVYIAEFARNRVIAAPVPNAKNPEEVPYVFQRYEGGMGPDGLAVDAEGNLYAAHFQAGEIVVCDANGFRYGAIRLPEEAGTFSTNMAFYEGYLYVTEALKNEVWRIKIHKEGLKLYGLQ